MLEQGRSQDFTWGPQKVSAEGARIEAPNAPRGVAIGEGCFSLSNRLSGLGEHREVPQRGPGRSPDRQRIFGIFEAHRTLLPG